MSDYLPDHEWSWILRRLNGFIITPSVRNQGRRPSCVFQAFSAATDMETKRIEALRAVPTSSNFSVHTHSYVGDYENLVGRKLGENDFGPGRVWSAAHLILHHGVIARGPGQRDRRLIRLANVQAHGNLEFQEIVELVRKGKPVIGGFTCNSTLKKLGRGEIYSFTPSIWLPTIHHMVVFVGYGSRGGRRYLVFLNSDGEGFSQDGFGRIWFDEVRDFHTIRIQGQPFHIDPILTHEPTESYSAGRHGHGGVRSAATASTSRRHSYGDVTAASSSTSRPYFDDATPSEDTDFEFIRDEYR